MSGRRDWQTVDGEIPLQFGAVAGGYGAAQLLKLRPEWRVVADDGKRILLVRSDTPEYLAGHSAGRNQGSKDHRPFSSPGLMKTTDAAEIV